MLRDLREQVFSCEFWEICKNIFFAEQDQAISSDHSRTDSGKWGIGMQNCKLRCIS